MKFIDVTTRIAREFAEAREKDFKKHPLAIAIRDDWPGAALNAIDSKWATKIRIKGSPGLGRWNEAPWLAFLHTEVTDTARAGYYPIILFEPGFETYCLVLAQGTDLLRETFGRKETRRVILDRANTLRADAKGWQKAGFEVGPFRTFSRLEGAVSDKDADGWSSSVAFGKRYSLDTPPPEAAFRHDLAAMIDIYAGTVESIGSSFATQDAEAGKLADDGELPPSGLDGAMKVVKHKKFEARARNTRLVRNVKKTLGFRCQGCLVDLTRAYPALGKEFIEAHHKRPLSEAPAEGVELTVADFAVLCPTCHRIIHRMGCPSLESFVDAIAVKLRDFHSELK